MTWVSCSGIWSNYWAINSIRETVCPGTDWSSTRKRSGWSQIGKKKVIMKSRLESAAGRTRPKGNSVGLSWSAADEYVTAHFLGHSVQVWVEPSATEHQIGQYFFNWAAASLLGWLTDMSVEQLEWFACLSPTPQLNFKGWAKMPTV